MLSGLANLLLGGVDTAVPEQETCNLKVTLAEDEWQLVDPESNAGHYLSKYLFIVRIICIFIEAEIFIS